MTDNDILMYSTHNEGKSVVGKRFIKTLKGKIYKKFTTSDSKSDLDNLNKLVDQYNHCSIGKKPVDTDYSALFEEIETNPKAPTFKVGDRVRITRYKTIFGKGYTKHWSTEIFVIDSVLKTNPLTCKIKDLNG